MHREVMRKTMEAAEGRTLETEGGLLEEESVLTETGEAPGIPALRETVPGVPAGIPVLPGAVIRTAAPETEGPQETGM